MCHGCQLRCRPCGSSQDWTSGGAALHQLWYACAHAHACLSYGLPLPTLQAAEAGHWAVARTAFERGVELDPQHPTMPDKLLALLEHLGDGPAAARLARLLLRQNPRHPGAAAALAAQQRGRPAAASSSATTAALLQLAPVKAGPGGPLCLLRGHHAGERERPRTLEQPTWQQLLHQSLLFLTGDRLVEGSPGESHAASAGAVAERKSPAVLVRFQIKRPPMLPSQQPPSQQPPGGPAAEAAATAAAALVAVAPPQSEDLAPSLPKEAGVDMTAGAASVTEADVLQPSVSPDGASALAHGQRPVEQQQGFVTTAGAAAPPLTDVASPPPDGAAKQAMQAASPGALPAPASTAAEAVAVSPAVTVGPPSSLAATSPAGEQEQQQADEGSSSKLKGHATRSR